jgi:diguanylate cyclase
MKQTEQTLLEQMRITEFEVAKRKVLLALTEKEFKLLYGCKSFIVTKLETLIDDFYETQTSIPEIALLIGDADTLNRLKNAQKAYILGLFSGVYDLEYVNNRLRIGLVHKRIGVEPKLYLSAISTLKGLLVEIISQELEGKNVLIETLSALDKLFLFDITLVFETYIRSMLAEIESSKEKSERYAMELEAKVATRTQELEMLSRVDALTGLLNVRTLHETLVKALRAAQRRSEPICVVYIDINDFKIINDTQGHHRGDEILRVVGASIKNVSRLVDSCFRYGGDEFCIILPDCSKEEGQEIYVKRLQDELGKNIENVKLSIGIAQTGPDEFVEAEVLIRTADELMYAHKKEFKEAKKKQD